MKTMTLIAGVFFALHLSAQSNKYDELEKSSNEIYSGNYNDKAQATDDYFMAGNCEDLEDMECALEYYVSAAKLGHVLAMYKAARFYELGLGTARNISEAIGWYQKAARNDHEESVIRLIRYYKDSDDTDQLFTWHLRAANLGIESSYFPVGLYYFEGEGTVQNYVEAFKWFKKAEDLNSVDVHTMLGHMYASGLGTEKNNQEAFAQFYKAANMGNFYSMFQLGNLYGDGIGVAVNETESTRWFLKAAEAGYSDAYLSLGQAYFLGTGTGKDLEKAIFWLKKATERDAEANFVLGSLYDFEEAVRDYAKAFHYYSIGADKGDSRAMVNLAQLYVEGKGTAKNDTKAFEWISRAAHKGNMTAIQNLYYCYANGFLVEKNCAEAKKWMQKLADSGRQDAIEAIQNFECD